MTLSELISSSRSIRSGFTLEEEGGERENESHNFCSLMTKDGEMNLTIILANVKLSITTESLSNQS